jgi:APA family basic amino acid/polyamine antiporter
MPYSAPAVPTISREDTQVTQQPTLARRLTTVDAVVIGIGSMVGAGVFVAFAPAANAAGNLLLIGLAIAAVIAFCNAVASAQLAARWPAAGGTYVYGRMQLGEWWGYLAGWGFVIGKTASCAAMAMTIAAYAAPDSRWLQRVVAVTSVVVLTLLNGRGITRTATMTRVFVTISLTCLAIVVGAILFSGETSPSFLTDWDGGGSDLYGVLQSAGLLFFAFAGYARIATLGEEVVDPARTIPRAIPIALGIAVVVYLVVGVTLLLSLGPDRLAGATAPVALAAEVTGNEWAEPIVRVGAIVAALGALLALIAGIGRTALAMAREHDLPAWLGAIHPVTRVPWRAELVVAGVVIVVVFAADIRNAIGFSSFGVLLYYAVANASAWTQTGAERRWPRAFNVLGLAGCLVLVVTLPPGAVIAGLAMFAVGIGWRLIALSRRPKAAG